jgi:hypothetical protein
MCTDYLFHNDNMVGYSILIVAASAQLIAGALLWHGRRHFVKSHDAAKLALAAQTA